MKTLNTVTAAKLIEILQELGPETKVAFSSDYGDHCHTQQIHRLRGEVEQVSIYETAYSDSGFAVAGEEREQREETGEKIYIIS